ncbi:MAG: FlgD immunoglobulin-like domain containing protein [Candidatus Eisenbacteria bacterium]
MRRNHADLISHTLLALLLIAACVLGCVRTGEAADLSLALPTLSAPPGGTVVIRLDFPPGLAGLDVYSMDFSMPLDPAVIQSSSVAVDGFLQFWGPPFTNGTASVVAGAAAGLTPVTSTATRMCSVFLTVKPSAIPGTVMPLTFSALHFNEVSPTVSFTPGSLNVVAGVDVPTDRTGGPIQLTVPWPNPARHVLRARLTLAARGNVLVSVHDLQGRRVRTLVSGLRDAGVHDLAWDGRTDAGGELSAGLYLLRAAGPGGVRTQRVAWVR